ncbi:hypothetical protein [Oricola indica]|uniref:hypothetical protein n=1 Tax=Oricola indica TaxID=2872591 RepID=UPI003CCC1CFC
MSQQDSNLFLRALWASLRARFGKLGWQYSPHKDGPRQRIGFGWMTLGSTSPDGVGVSIQYARVGVIKAIEFVPRGTILTIHPLLEGILRECVEEAVGRMRTPIRISCSTQVASFPRIPVGYYRGDGWYFGPLDNGNTEIGITVRAFDKPDADYDFASRLPSLLDVLACMTNCAFERVNGAGGRTSASEEALNSYFDKPDWLEDFPIDDGHLRLTLPQLKFLTGLLEGPVSEDRVTRAARMFHKALTLFRRVPKCLDVSTALFVSALEAVDLPSASPAVCPKCSQPVYKISRRVVDLGIRHLGPNVERIFKDHYQLRSMYLHRGEVRSSRPISPHFIPLLDPDGVEGCAMPAVTNQPLNLMEFTGFVIRAELLLGKPNDAAPLG